MRYEINKIVLSSTFLLLSAFGCQDVSQADEPSIDSSKSEAVVAETTEEPTGTTKQDELTLQLEPVKPPKPAVKVASLKITTPAPAPLYTVSSYDPFRNPAQDLAQAVRQAKKSNKRIICQIGGNWCGWCHRLENMFRRSNRVATVLGESFLIMKVNVSRENPNSRFLSQFGPIASFPHLLIIDNDGTLLRSQSMDGMEQGGGYSETAILAMLDRWATIE